jgi:SEC-C motif domain protein
VPASAEELMRSRYSAYVIGARDYLLATWHPTTRPASLELDQRTTWLGLQIKAHAQQDADHATVEFVARYRVAGKGHRLHEISRFGRVNGRWLYVDGSFAQSKQFVK